MQHKPRVNWGESLNPILQWGPLCASHCLQSSSSAADEGQTDLIRYEVVLTADLGGPLPPSEAREESQAWDSTVDYLWEGSPFEGGSELEDVRDSMSHSSKYFGILVGDLNFPMLSNIPSEYADLAEVFSKQRATTLPPHGMIVSLTCTPAQFLQGGLFTRCQLPKVAL